MPPAWTPGGPDPKMLLELHHSRRREEQGGIAARDQGIGRDDAVPVSLEKVQEFPADVVGEHFNDYIKKQPFPPGRWKRLVRCMTVKCRV